MHRLTSRPRRLWAWAVSRRASSSPFFIVALNWVDLVTLGSLLLACLGLLAALHNRLSLALAVMLLAFLVDILDGALARRFGQTTELGRYLDSLGDVVTYLLLPMFVLYQFGLRDPLSLALMFGFVAAGVLRLARFNTTGVIADEAGLYYLGLPVVWSHLLVVLAFPLWHWWETAARYVVLLALPVMSVYMLRNFRFRKPTGYVGLGLLIISLAAVYACLHFAGIFTP